MDKSRNLEIDVLSVNSWTMHAQVADSFTNEHNNVFLAGDAAHRFPPAGQPAYWYTEITLQDSIVDITEMI